MKERTALFIHYNEAADMVELYLVRQAFDKGLDQWIDQEEPRLSVAYPFFYADTKKGPKIAADQSRAEFVHADILAEIAKGAEIGLAFLGRR